MPKIFISYRREDSKHAVGRLHAALARHVRNPKRDIFIDIDNIPRGVDFVDHLDGQVAQCDIMLAVIGPGWLTAKDAKTGKRRLDDPQDFVRIEVASALKRGIPVVPVVLDDTKIPVAEDLPDDLRLLVRRNGERLEHESFAADVARLIKNLPARDARSAMTASRLTKPAASGGGWIGPVVALTFLALAGGGAWAWIANPGDWRGSDPQTIANVSDDVPKVTTTTNEPSTSANAPTQPSADTPPPAPPKAELGTGKSVIGSTNADDDQLANSPVRLVLEHTLAGQETTVDASFSRDGTLVVTTSRSGAARVWRVADGQLLVTLPVNDGDSNQGVYSRLSPDGRQVLTVANDRNNKILDAQIWDVATGKSIATLPGHSNLIGDAAFTPDSRTVVTSDWDNKAIIWNSADGRSLGDLHGASNFAISPDGSRIASSEMYGPTLTVWDITTKKSVAILQGHQRAQINSIAYSRDGSRIVSTSFDNTARIWDAESGKLLFSLPHGDAAMTADFSPDGLVVVTASNDKNVRFWDAKTGKLLGAAVRMNEMVRGLEFSPDGSKIIAVCADGSGQLLNARSHQRLAAFTAFWGFSYQYRNSFWFSADGSRIVTSGPDGDANIWRIEPK